MKLLFYISLVDAMIGFNLLASHKVCSWGLYKFFAKTVLKVDSTDTLGYWEALWTLIISMNIYSVWLLFATVMLNSCLACDLILMIKYPFKIKDKRMPWYIASSFSVATFLALATLFTVYFD